MSWYGWVWQFGEWHRVTGPHNGLSLCSRALGHVAKGRKVPGRHQAMTTGAPPTFTPAQETHQLAQGGLFPDETAGKPTNYSEGL
jgi:hypothetical protein